MLKRIIPCLVGLVLMVPAVNAQDLSLRDEIQKMYVAYYGRPGDENGLRFWASELANNQGDMSAIIDVFGNSEEYQTRFGHLTSEQLVENIYLQLFNRSAEPAGLAFYVNELDTGAMSLATIALSVANGADSENSDGMTVLNRIAVANVFTRTVLYKHVTYGAEQIDAGKLLLESVDDTSESTTKAVADMNTVIEAFPQLENVQVEVTTNYGVFTVELFNREAPVSVNNFLNYVDTGFYNEVIFHRVVANFVIQAGYVTSEYALKNATFGPIVNEAANGLSNVRGTLAMARTSEPDSATAQFYINLKDNTDLDYSDSSAGYAVFGEVKSGIDIIDTIGEVDTHTVSTDDGSVTLRNFPVPLVNIEKIERIQ
ncbi:hypothetical protein OLMES_0931 [Oleiphilus messinensis]|uniref:peptidylprolyl isomerase n=1 Tax=Oleiphilus messinensis TaxID=141451 RepID=A0A1Y0I3D5_9GAMM|nr:peptidylprolyl isomerase [Oleiphilus messinensis]ARU55018.1 hypothetical protein OLMES_0931 [Oleiphilus messinensis]